MSYDFQERLSFSQGARLESDKDTIKSILTGCEEVVEAPVALDKKGVDYVATLRRGSEVYIDAKTRDKGCSRYWKEGPELAIEIWSVCPDGKYKTHPERSKAGWTLDEAKITDMILYTFDSSDCETVFLVPFQSLRMAAAKHLKDWKSTFKVDVQDSGSWQSQAVFVPANIVLEAVSETFTHEHAEQER